MRGRRSSRSAGDWETTDSLDPCRPRRRGGCEPRRRWVAGLRRLPSDSCVATRPSARCRA